MNNDMTNNSKSPGQTKSVTLSEKRKKLSGQKKRKKTKDRSANAISPPETQIKSLLEYHQIGRYSDAEKLALSMTQQFPLHQFGWKALGVIYGQTGRTSESLVPNKMSVQLAPHDAQAHYNLGIILKKHGKLDDAEASYKQAITLKPDHADACYNLGIMLRELGRLEEAEARYKQVIALKPDYAEAHNNLGNTLQELGRLDEAEASYSQAIALKPDHAEAHYNLGNTLQELGRLDEAETSYLQAIALKPDYAGAHNNVGITIKELGRLEESEASFRQAIMSKPDYAEAHNNLGNALKELGRLDEARASYAQAIALKSGYAEAHSNLGNTLKELGRLVEAEASHSQAIALKPDYAEAHNKLGVTLKELRRLDDAETSYRQAIVLKPDYAAARSNLGITLHELGRLDEAEESFRKAIALEPHLAEAHHNLGITLQKLGRLDEAENSYKQALALKADYAEAHNDLGIIFRKLGRLDEAESSYQQAIALKPEYAEAHSNLGNALKELGKLNKAEASFRRAIALKPEFVEAHSNLLFFKASMKFDESSNLKDLQGFADIVAEQKSSPYSTWSISKSPTELRVGFVSGDFKEHPVGYFLEGLLVQLQSSSIELYAYETNNSFGEVTSRLKGIFHSWTSLSGKSDKDAALTIHNDGIHILIDLSGHTLHNRLPVFGWKPAPIQIAWLGYFASTGLPEIDYIIGDPFVTPQSEAHHFTEKIWQLPDSYLCFTPPERNFAVSPLPAKANGFLTFGCFNSLSRMTDEVISVRANILHAIPNSKLFLKDKRLGYQAGRDQILKRFATYGIDEGRLLLEGRSNRGEYLTSYHRVDIALSPFPYGGGTTSVEGLWMGVPVIAKKGNYFLSHLGESIAHNTNLSDWIAVDNEDYISKAIEFSSDLNALEMLRRSLRENLLKTPMYDVPRFANNFEKALWKMRDSIEY